jgi:hypothetical protein
MKPFEMSAKRVAEQQLMAKFGGAVSVGSKGTLRCVIVRHDEGHMLVELHFSLAVEGHELRADGDISAYGETSICLSS